MAIVDLKDEPAQALENKAPVEIKQEFNQITGNDIVNYATINCDAVVISAAGNNNAG